MKKKIMNKLKIILLAMVLTGLLSSCGTVKDAFSMQKKNSTDEFLVEKKNPLKLPPNFDELPVPNAEKGLNESDNKEQIEKLLKSEDNGDDQKLKTETKLKKSFNERLLGKIKNN